MDFRERDVPVRGMSLRVRERGPQEGPTCVLLHGWLDHRGSFDLLAPLLPGRTVAVDQRGHGDSSWAGAGAFYHFVEYAGDLDVLVREMQLPLPIRLVGHSMGGAVSLLYAAARPDLVAHLTLLDAAPLLIAPAEVPDRLSGWLEDLATPRRRRAPARRGSRRARPCPGRGARLEMGPAAARALSAALHEGSPPRDRRPGARPRAAAPRRTGPPPGRAAAPVVALLRPVAHGRDGARDEPPPAHRAAGGGGRPDPAGVGRCRTRRAAGRPVIKRPPCATSGSTSTSLTACRSARTATSPRGPRR